MADEEDEAVCGLSYSECPAEVVTAEAVAVLAAEALVEAVSVVEAALEAAVDPVVEDPGEDSKANRDPLN